MYILYRNIYLYTYMQCIDIYRVAIVLFLTVGHVQKILMV